jgi:hypothetical protein
MEGDDDKQTARSAKSDLLAKKPEEKGAAPPEKPSITLDKPNLSKSYETKKAAMADNTVQTSESDRGKDNDPPPGGTSTPMPPSRHILVPETPDHGGEADTSKVEDEDTLIESGSHQVLQVPTLTVGGKTIKTAKGKESRSITSDASSQGSRTSRTRGDAKQIAAGIPLEANVSKKLEKKGAGQGRGRAPPERRASIVVRAKVSKLNKDTKAAKLAADNAEKENAGKSKH